MEIGRWMDGWIDQPIAIDRSIKIIEEISPLNEEKNYISIYLSILFDG